MNNKLIKNIASIGLVLAISTGLARIAAASDAESPGKAEPEDERADIVKALEAEGWKKAKSR